MTMKTTLSLGLLALLSSSTSPTNAQGTGNPADTGNHVTPPEPAVPGQVDHWDMWNWTGAQSVYWHTRYHGCLAMAAYGDYRNTCPQFFTRETLQRQYPGNPNVPFEVIGSWGPTPIYGSEGFMVKVHEMNKILMVFKGIYGWENFNSTLAPMSELVGCSERGRCQAMHSAIEAWEEVKNATNDMQAIKENQGDLVWSASGHGFGGCIMQVGALELKNRGLLFSAQTFGSPPCFNTHAARRWDDLFISDASQRTVSNRDSVPAKIPYNNQLLPDGTRSNSSYAFVNTGIHVWTDPSIQEAPMGGTVMYGQNYVYCLHNREDPRCAGGDREEDHYFYFTEAGSCCDSSPNGYQAQANSTRNREILAGVQAAYNATATAPVQSVPNTSMAPSSTSTPTTTSAADVTSDATATGLPTDAAVAPNNAAVQAEASSQAVFDKGAAGVGKMVSMSAVALAGAMVAGLVVL